jgi:CheY-like chemotaxis protein
MTPLPSPHQPPATGQRAQAAGGRAVLLVDDDEINRMVAQAFLQSIGCVDVWVAANGEEALALCAEHGFALVLMDCVMPVMDGFGATRRMRARGLRMPVIALTASTGPADIARCLAAGMDDHVAKPLDLQRLAATLAHWLPAAGAPALN